MKSIRRLAQTILFVTICVTGLEIRAATNPFLGYWSLHLPGGGMGWLGVSGGGDDLKADMLWIGGSVFPLDSAKLEDGKLVVTRRHETDRKSSDGKPIIVIETLTATLNGDIINFVTVTPKPDGGENRAEFSGHRQPQ